MTDISASAPASDDVAAPATSGARAILGVVRTYQFVRLGRVSPCRFVPTCSEYAAQAVTEHGSRHGLILALRRLGRCRPGGPSGYDPVPEKVG